MQILIALHYLMEFLLHPLTQTAIILSVYYIPYYLLTGVLKLYMQYLGEPHPYYYTFSVSVIILVSLLFSSMAFTGLQTLEYEYNKPLHPHMELVIPEELQ